MNPVATLWYFADPMCSWCWGLSPVLEKIKEDYGEKLKIALMLGGLRPGTTEPITPELRSEILHHWKAVHEMTGQEFDFADPMPDGFIYDTEPPSRAVIAVSEINPDYTLPYFKTIQEAFYCHKQNVTDIDVLVRLAEQFSINTNNFLEHYNSDDVKTKTQLHFQHTRQAEVRGFPTLVIQAEKDFNMLANGYRSYTDLKKDIDDWLRKKSLTF